jgi:hypothetical protein
LEPASLDVCALTLVIVTQTSSKGPLGDWHVGGSVILVVTVPVEAPPPPPPPQLINAKLSAINTANRIIKKRISLTIGFVPMSLLLYS